MPAPSLLAPSLLTPSLLAHPVQPVFRKELRKIADLHVGTPVTGTVRRAHSHCTFNRGRSCRWQTLAGLWMLGWG